MPEDTPAAVVPWGPRVHSPSLKIVVVGDVHCRHVVLLVVDAGFPVAKTRPELRRLRPLVV